MLSDKARFATTLAAALLPLVSVAQQQSYEAAAPAPLRPPVTGLSLRAGAQHLTGGYGDWREVSLQGTHETGPHVVQGELSTFRRFHENGVFVGLADTYTWNPDWYTRLSVGAGDNAFFLPRWRVDGSLHRKLLADRQLVASVGLGFVRMPDGHEDKSLTLGGVYYFKSPWIVQGGVRFNNSSPGSVDTRQQWLAASYGRSGADIVTARYGWGREGYQAIGQASSLVDFSSKEGSVAWRHWMAPNWGLQLSLEAYRNPVYHRAGGSVELFWQ